MSSSTIASAGPPAEPINLERLIDAYFITRPDPDNPAQRVVFGTSGHRGSSLKGSFNEAHIRAISQAIALYRRGRGISGPLFIGTDTHALSSPAFVTALEVFAANGVTMMVSEGEKYTPTPAVSHAILRFNKGRTHGMADGVVITPSHNPPEDGGFKYNGVNGGPADTQTTAWIEAKANAILAEGLGDVRQWTLSAAISSEFVHAYDFVGSYINDLINVIDVNVIQCAGLNIGVDPLGGAGVHYWGRIAERYGLRLNVLNPRIDKAFEFVPPDSDGQIRMDPASATVMAPLVARRQEFDIAVACDTDHDRHGIVTPDCGLVPPNHYLTASINYLSRYRTGWSPALGIGKSIVTTGLISRLAIELRRPLYEMPVGFKWFGEGLSKQVIGFAGEESAGATFNRLDGSVWTKDKDGIVLALLAAEILARTGRSPSEHYAALIASLGEPSAARIDVPATPAQKRQLAGISRSQVTAKALAGDPITEIQDRAPANAAPLGGIKIVTEHGWFAARPSGTEALYKLYAESFRDGAHLHCIQEEGRALVDLVFSGGGGNAK